jgi:ATP-dependent Clp protease ATP-binding subunit ClpX
LIPEFAGRLPIIANFRDLSKEMLARVMTEPRNSIYNQFKEILRSEGVLLTMEARVFEQIAELAFEYKVGARSLRGIFEELMTPVLFRIPDDPGIAEVVFSSFFQEPQVIRRQPAA